MRVCQKTLQQLASGVKSLEAITAAIGTERRTVVNAVQQLKRRGLVEITAPGQYALTESGHEWVASGRVVTSGQSGTRPRTVTRGLRQRCWWVLRSRETATLPELLGTLANGNERDATGNLRRYLKALVESGFLSIANRRAAGNSPKSNGHLRYMLVRDNGRLAPVVRQSNGTVFDPNINEVFVMRGRDEPSA